MARTSERIIVEQELRTCRVETEDEVFDALFHTWMTTQDKEYTVPMGIVEMAGTGNVVMVFPEQVTFTDNKSENYFFFSEENGPKLFEDDDE